MSQEKVFVVVNPSSGGGRGRILEGIIYWMRDKHPLRDIHFDIANSTERDQGSIKTLALMAKNAGYKKIAFVGGDGTFNEGVNVLAGSDVSLALIPAGVANDSAKGLGIPLDPRKAVINAFFGREKLIDLGIVDDERFFLNVLSFCLDARIAKQMSIRKKPFFPFPVGLYAGLILKEVFFRKKTFPRITLSQDGKEDREKETLALVVSNGPQYGLIFKIAPGASFTDGLLNVCWVNKMSNLSLVRTIPRVINGTHGDLEKVERFKADSFSISSPEILSCQVDGEPFDSKRDYRIGIRPKALKVITP